MPPNYATGGPPPGTVMFAVSVLDRTHHPVRERVDLLRMQNLASEILDERVNGVVLQRR